APATLEIFTLSLHDALPIFITITGGSIGFQVGVQSVDLVLIFKHAESLENIGTGSFTLGGDVSVTVGPEGRNSSANTDYKFEARSEEHTSELQSRENLVCRL